MERREKDRVVWMDFGEGFSLLNIFHFGVRVAIIWNSWVPSKASIFARKANWG